MVQPGERGGRIAPCAARYGLDSAAMSPRARTLAALAAVLLLAAPAAPALAAAAAALLPAALVGLAAATRRDPRLVRVAVLLAAWHGAMLGAAFLLGSSRHGLPFVLLALWTAPLPVLPWVYVRTFPRAGAADAPDADP